MTDRLCVGVVIGAHGIKGALRIKSFTADPADLAGYGPLETETGQPWRVLEASVGTKGVVTVRVAAVTDRSQAEAAKGVKLYVARQALPEPDDGSYYVSDLVGMTAVGLADELLGKVTAVFNFGAGDVIEIKGEGADFMVPFTLQAVPMVDLAGRRIRIDPPVMVEGEEEPDGG